MLRHHQPPGLGSGRGLDHGQGSGLGGSRQKCDEGLGGVLGLGLDADLDLDLDVALALGLGVLAVGRSKALGLHP